MNDVVVALAVVVVIILIFVSDTDVISEIEEPSSCTYLFTVSTIRICSHPRFREEKVKKAAAISCSPALSQPEFEKYTKLQVKRC